MRKQIFISLMGSLLLQPICLAASNKTVPKANDSDSPNPVIQKIISASQAGSLPDRIVDRIIEKCNDNSTQQDNLVSTMPFAKDMPAEKQQEMQAQMAKGKKVFVEQLQKYRSILALPQFMQNVWSAILGKYYTDADLQVILRFWQSPTGQKTAKLLPQINEDYTKMAVEYFIPKFMEIFKDIMSNPEVQNRLNSLKMQRMGGKDANVPPMPSRKSFEIEPSGSSNKNQTDSNNTPDSSKTNSTDIQELVK